MVDTAVVPMSPLTTVRMPVLVVPAEPPKVPNGAIDASGIAAGAEQFEPAGATVKLQVKSTSIVLAGTAKSFTPFAPPSIVAV